MNSNPTAVSLLLVLIVIGTGCTETTAPTAPPVEEFVDTAPPAIPTGLWAVPTEHAHVKLAWNPNSTDEDLEGYLVYRLAFGQTNLLTDEPVAEARYIDTSPLGGPCIYAVTSVDILGNESGWTQIRYNCDGEDPEMRLETP